MLDLAGGHHDRVSGRSPEGTATGAQRPSGLKTEFIAPCDIHLASCPCWFGIFCDGFTQPLGSSHRAYGIESPGLWDRVTGPMGSSHRAYGIEPPGLWDRATGLMGSSHRAYGIEPPGLWDRVTVEQRTLEDSFSMSFPRSQQVDIQKIPCG
jgi:hypothetical protein